MADCEDQGLSGGQGVWVSEDLSTSEGGSEGGSMGGSPLLISWWWSRE